MTNDSLFRAFKTAWRPFTEDHGRWLEARQQEDTAVYALPETAMASIRSLHQLDELSATAEREFAAICKASGAVGVRGGEPIIYQPLRPRPVLDRQAIDRWPELGWSEGEIKAAIRLAGKVDDVERRVQGAAGRLVADPAFLKELESLRKAWKLLPEGDRPPLPFLLVTDTPRKGSTSIDPPKSKLTAFLVRLRSFLRRWRLNGLVDWHLPVVAGPLLPDPRPRADQPEGIVRIDVPFHFPLKAEDDVGEFARRDHDRLVEMHGVEDEGRWETYARLFEINHWELVLGRRYADKPRRNGFVGRLEGALARILHVELDRAKKLRKHLRALRSGKKRSLVGFR